MSVGVANKENKKAVFVGTTLNYGFNKDEILLRVYVNCAEKKMLIVNSTSTNQQEEIFQNLPVFPFYPTLINKGNSQATVRYSLVTDDPAIL